MSRSKPPLSSLSKQELIDVVREKQSEIKQLRAELDSTSNVDHNDGTNVAEWSAKFHELQEQLHTAIVASREEKTKLEERIGELEFEKAETETMQEYMVDSEKQTFEQQIRMLRESYEQRIRTLQQTYEKAMVKFEQALEKREKEFTTKLKTLKSSSNDKGRLSRKLMTRLEQLEKKLMETFEANRLEKALLLERLNLAKTDAQQLKARVNKLDMKNGDFKARLENKEIELLNTQTRLHEEWTEEVEQLTKAHKIEIQKLTDEVSRMQSAGAELEKINDDLRIELEERTRAVDSDQLQEEVIQLKKKVADLEDQLAEQEEEVEKVRDIFEQKMKEKTAVLTEQFQKLQADLLQAKKRVAEIKK